jgi:hypothetical protein
MTRPLYAFRKGPRYPLNRALGDPKAGLDNLEKRVEWYNYRSFLTISKFAQTVHGPDKSAQNVEFLQLVLETVQLRIEEVHSE